LILGCQQSRSGYFTLPGAGYLAIGAQLGKYGSKAARASRWLTRGSCVSQVLRTTRRVDIALNLAQSGYHGYQGYQNGSPLQSGLAALGLGLNGRALYQSGLIGDTMRFTTAWELDPIALRQLSRGSTLNSNFFNLPIRRPSGYGAFGRGNAPRRGVVQYDAPIGPQPAPRGELSPGELATGRFADLPGSVGDNVTGHHMPSSKYIREVLGMEHADGIAMNMQHFYPSNTGRHPLTRTFGSKGRNSALLDETFREALGRDIRDARRIYMENGMYGPDVRRALREVIDEWRSLRPDLF